MMITQLIQHLLDRIENRIMELPGDSNKVECHGWIYVDAYFAISLYVISQHRGPGGLLLDLEGLCKHFNSEFGRVAMAAQKSMWPLPCWVR